MACHLMGAKLLPEPMWLIFNWTEQISGNLNQNMQILFQDNAFKNQL